MPSLRPLTESEVQSLWTEVRAEFPDDEMMQEVHFVRALHAIQLRDFTREERLAYLNRFASQTAAHSA